MFSAKRMIPYTLNNIFCSGSPAVNTMGNVSSKYADVNFSPGTWANQVFSLGQINSFFCWSGVEVGV